MDMAIYSLITIVLYEEEMFNLILNNLKKEEQMTNIVDMTSVAEGDTSSLDRSGIEVKRKTI